jgi:hypothetical protein
VGEGVSVPPMGLGAIHDDVVFDPAGAADLMRQLRLTADMLDDHGNARPAFAADARAEWRGVYAEQFDADQRTATAASAQLAAALRAAADGLGELAEAARREQQRREAARAWEKQQGDRNLFQKGWDNARDFVMGDDDIPAPRPAEAPPRFLGERVATGR